MIHEAIGRVNDVPMTPSITVDDLLDRHPLLRLAWTGAQASSAFLLNERPPEVQVSTKSSPTDAVSEMDTGSEALLIECLLGARPNDGLLGEEGGERIGTTGVRWVVDPLDGTVNYLYRLPIWGVSVAAEVDGSTAVGVVVAPELGEAYVAAAGQGAWFVRGDVAERIIAPDLAELSLALVATGFSYDAGIRAAQGSVIRQLLPQVRDLRRMGAAVVDFCWLARGRVDGYFEQSLNPWDLAAGALIAREAGIVVRGVHGEDEREGVMVAAKPGIAEALRIALIEAGA